MFKLIHKVWAGLTASLFPKTCFGCSKKGQYFCQNCLKEVRDPNIIYPRSLDFALTSFSYRTPAVRKALRKLKYASASDVAEELAKIMAEDLAPYLKYDRIKPMVCEIPMTEKRKRKRGFNQAEVLAKHLAKFLNLEYSPILIKVRETKPQVEIENRKERLKNIKRAFQMKGGIKASPFVVLVDDIITTGATISEAARVLKKAGAKKIIGVAVAR